MNKARILIVVIVSLVGLLLGATLARTLQSSTRTVVEPIDVSVPGGAEKVLKKDATKRSLKSGRGSGPVRRRSGSSDGGFQPAPPPAPIRAGDDDPDETDDDSGDD